MITPFPGMDPYLEHPALWPGVHARLIVWLAHQLRPLIRPRYVTTIEDRVFIEGLEHQRSPDIWVQKARGSRARKKRVPTETATPVVIEAEPPEIREHYIEILDTYRKFQVVTVIEVVSPGNKAAGPGRDAYLEKQGANLSSEANLVEIDLLRRGQHVLSVPRGHTRSLKPYDYLICVNRATNRGRFELYPRRLRERLPTIPLPLAGPDPDVPLDIQMAFEQVYEDGDYMLRVLYDEPCKPALKPAEQRWANERWAAYQAAHPDLFPQGGP